MLYFTALPDFNQSLLDFFNLDDSQVGTRIHTAVRLPKSCNQRGSALGCWSGSPGKGSREFRAAAVCSWTVLRPQCAGMLAVLLKDKIVVCDMFTGSYRLFKRPR